MRALLASLAILISAPVLAAEVTGYVESRTQYQRSRVAGLLPTDAQPELQQLLELNVQPRQEYRPGGFISADLSLFLQASGRYRGLDANGNEVPVAEKESSAAKPLVSLNELYVSHEVVPQLHLLAGKKRVIWGAGMAFNPTDLINPPKDPTDPNFQRAGAYMVRVEVPLEKYAFTLLASPAVLEQQNGLPRALLAYPKWDRKDDELHYLLAARAYALVADADINLMLFHSNLYGDAFEDKTRLGFSFSRYFFTDYELHVEGLVGLGSARRYPVGGCLEDRLSAVGCVLRGEAFFSTKRLDERKLRPRVLAGTRYMFGDESMLSVEYLYQADGLKRDELQHYVNALGLLRVARDFGLDPSGVDPGGSVDTGLPQKFSFEPLGRHYAFISYQKPKIRDDFTFNVVVMASLQDLSGLITPSLSWAATEWMTLTLSGFVPWQGPDSLAVKVPESDTHVSELSLMPIEYRGLFQVRLFY
ncbi:hypothetical protein ATI61_11247 [Archangium gephyra]|uniref:Capsule assembly Wzi family protein n=1 Tax=Archangium gephyra TaxID=48 RepID=A0AAC8Q547_9BACT|nr:hypothetical protein [Archangium gephyra]AKJ00789.1 Hypothetical protein AA314_02415 [Archangium gephyra]REG25952.1 hypothetical protein ATI61_11247 [Archangium gephyra]